MRLSIRPKTALRSLAVLAAASLTAVGLAACSTGSSGSAGSATSGTIKWEGWTPTDTATAKLYISAFNKQYPKIKVNYKLVNISDWVAALRPALASGKGPDVFDMQPGAYVTQFKSFAEDLTPVAKSALGADWKSKIAPIGVSGLTASGKLTVDVGRLRLRRDALDQPGPVRQVQPDAADHAAGVGEGLPGLQVERRRAASCRAPRRRASTRTPCSRSRTRCSPGLWTKASDGRRRSGATRAS